MKYYIIYLSMLITVSCKDITDIADKDMPITIQKVINRNATDSFLVDSISNFDWDEMYILKPYLTESQYKEIEKRVDNLPRMGAATFSNDQEIYFVFAKKGKAIKVSEIPMYPFDFSYVGNILNPVVLQKGTFLHYKKNSDGRIIIY